MSNILRVLPLEMVAEVASRMEPYSLVRFKTTCKVANKLCTDEMCDAVVINDIRERLQNVIKVVTEYHNTVQQIDYKEYVTKEMLMKWHKYLVKYEVEHSKKAFWAKSAAFRLVREICDKYNCTERDVMLTWKRYISNEPVFENHSMILEGLKEFVIGSKDTYKVLFEYKAGRYSNILYLTFDANGEIVMQPFLLDTQSDFDTWEKADKMKKQIPGAHITKNNKLQLNVNDESLYGLAKYINEVFGRPAYMTKTSAVSYIRKHCIPQPASNICHRILDFFVDRDIFKNKLVDILDYQH